MKAGKEQSVFYLITKENVIPVMTMCCGSREEVGRMNVAIAQGLHAVGKKSFEVVALMSPGMDADSTLINECTSVKSLNFSLRMNGLIVCVKRYLSANPYAMEHPFWQKWTKNIFGYQ